MSHLSTARAVVGKRVLYAGERDDGDVLNSELLKRGHVLMHGHPGVVQKFYGPGLNHCIVQFVGLEAEPISWAVGFDHTEDGYYSGLLDPEDHEWDAALSSGWWTQTP